MEQKPLAVLKLPDPEERLLFMGANGSGKSQLAREMLDGFQYWFVIDLKGDFEPISADYIIVKKPTDRRLKQFRKKYPCIVYRPLNEYRNKAWFDFILSWAWDVAKKTMKGKKQLKPFVLYVDEGLMTADLGGDKWISNHAVGSRALGVALWVAAQRPKNIPVAVRSEAWRWYVFYLAYEDDEKEVVKYAKGKINLEDMDAALSNYGFFEIRRIKGGGITIQHFPAMRVTPSEPRREIDIDQAKRVGLIAGIVAAFVLVIGLFIGSRKRAA